MSFIEFENRYFMIIFKLLLWIQKYTFMDIRKLKKGRLEMYEF